MRKPLPTLLLLALSVALSASATIAQAAQATVTRSSELRSKPFSDAPLITTLAEQSEVTILSADGGWNEVKTREGKTGWVRLLNLRTKAAGDSSSSLKGLGELGNVARTGTTGSSATTGAKGISKEDLASASPNEGEVRKLETYRATLKDAQHYASQNKLKARDVAVPTDTANH